MAVETIVQPRAYLANGTQTQFIAPSALAAADLGVWLKSAAGAFSKLSVGANFTVAGSASEGFSVVLSVAPAAGTTVIIERDTPATQPTTFKDLSRFPASSVEGAHDRTVTILQDLMARAKRLAVELGPAETPLNPISRSQWNGKVAVPQADNSWLFVATTDLEALGGRTAQIDALSARTAALDALAAVSSALDALSGSAADLSAVAPVVGDVAAVAAIVSDIVAVAPNVQAVSTLAGLAQQVADLGARTVEIASLGARTTQIDRLNASADEIDRLNASADALDRVNASVANLDAVAAELPVIASKANASDVGSPDGLGPLMDRAAFDGLFPDARERVLTADGDIVLTGLERRVGPKDGLGALGARTGFHHLFADNRERELDEAGNVFLTSLERRVGAGDGFGALHERTGFYHLFPVDEPFVMDATGAVFRAAHVRENLPLLSAFIENGNVFVADGVKAYRLTDRVDAPNADEFFNPNVDERFISWTVGHGTDPSLSYGGSRRAFRIPRNPARWCFGSEIKRVIVVVMAGQSQRTGWHFSIASGTDVPVDSRRVGMLGQDVRLAPSAGSDNAVWREHRITPDQIDGVVPLLEQRALNGGAGGTTPAHGLARTLLPTLPSDTGILVINACVGAQTIQNLARGKAAFSNMAEALRAFDAMARARGVETEREALLWSQGGSSRYDSVAVHRAHLEGIYDAFDQLNQEDGYAAHAVPMFVTLMHHESQDVGNPELMTVARAQLEFTQDLVRNVVGVAPEYVLISANDEAPDPAAKFGSEDSLTTHVGPVGSDWWGGYDAFALIDTRLGQTHEILRALSASRPAASAVVTLDYNLTADNIVTPLVLGGAHIRNTADGNWGFEYVDDGDGNTVTITGVVVNGSDQVEITLSAVPTGSNPKVRIGFGSTAEQNWQGLYGARCGLRDSRTGTIIAGGFPRTLFNHAGHQELEVTVI